MNYLYPPKELANYGIGVAVDYQQTCVICNKNPAQVFYNAHPAIRTNQVFPCIECNQVETHESVDFYEQNPTALFKNKQGHEVAVDQRGKQMKTNPYEGVDKRIDRHGWTKTHRNEYKRTLRKQGKI